MMIDFPANPTTGQQFTAAGVTWTFDGAKWTAAGLGAAYLPLAGGTMLGDLVLNRDPVLALGAATKEYVDTPIAAIIGSGAEYGGFVNKLRNGAFDVWQRGSPITVAINSIAYTADGWQVYAVGAAIIVQVGAYTNGPTANVFQLGSAAASTQVQFFQRIEGAVAAPLASQNCTFQAMIFNNTGATFTPQLQVTAPTAIDTWGTQNTVLAPTNLQPCPDGMWTKVAYTFTAPANANFGLCPDIQFQGGIKTGGVLVAACDLRATPGWPIGLCANPPPPELRPIATELALCQRYYMQPNIQFQADHYASAASEGLITEWSTPVTMRVVPTVIASWSNEDNCTGGPIASLVDNRTIIMPLTSLNTGLMVANVSINSLSAEL